MMRNKAKPTTSSSSQVSINWYSKIFSWVSIWWLVMALVFVLLIAGIFKYLWNIPLMYSLSLDLIKAISILLVAMYVIYTRLLSIETKSMAQASIGLFNSERGTVLIDLLESNCDFTDLSDQVKNLTKEIHLKDKKLRDTEIKSLENEKNAPAISVKIKNMSGRRIEASKIDFKARHTGSDNFYDLCCDITRIGTILPWEDKVIHLILAPEGEVEIITNSFEYLDGGLVHRLNVVKSIQIERIRKPEVIK